jgi:hypothetical protein
MGIPQKEIDRAWDLARSKHMKHALTQVPRIDVAGDMIVIGVASSDLESAEMALGRFLSNHPVHPLAKIGMKVIHNPVCDPSRLNLR